MRSSLGKGLLVGAACIAAAAWLGCRSGSVERPNVILVVIDTLRADSVRPGDPTSRRDPSTTRAPGTPQAAAWPIAISGRTARRRMAYRARAVAHAEGAIVGSSQSFLF